MLPTWLLLFAIQTNHSLTLRQGTYESLLFRVDTGSPEQVQFTTAGNPPPGMIFENTPCHKPGEENCVAMASANGIYLDGVPESAGTFHFTINAKQGDQQTSREFTVTVKEK
jgi:hypothetical protein